ncbi:MAG TPA: mechanosensitive ion channel family protein [Pseudonocardiaceae bacterium]|nr:mechanosensitive ion channel family protein [Pseudonocardiaceae bacterium]
MLNADVKPSCADDASTWCGQVWNVTHNSWLAESAGWLLAKPLNILAVVIVAVVVRLLMHRLIRRLTSGTGKVPLILRPLRERAPQTLASLVSERRSQRAKTIGSVLQSITSFVVWGIALVLILGDLGFNLTPIIASAGVIGVAVGFGAQNLVKDFLSGIFMLLEDQYGVGDVVDLGEATGTVESVGLRVTTVRDYTGTVWYVRNGEVQRVGNSSQGFAVAVVDIPVHYTTDVNEALRLLTEVAENATEDEPLATDVLEPPKVLGVQGMTADNITLRMTVKVRPARQWATQRELFRRIMAVFEQDGIRPPISSSRPAIEGE